jgi:phosphoribosylanthranilate isomerase
MNLRVKICGITQVTQGRPIAQMGATALGFICVPNTPRYVTPEQIQAIVAELPIHSQTGQPICDRVGVFLNHTVAEICRTVTIANLNAVQLHGTESSAFCQELRQCLPEIELIKAFRVRSLSELEATTAYAAVVDALLLDAYDPRLPGGTGKVLNWQALHSCQPQMPWLLSGGLTPDNVQEALNWVTPTGIDLSSGVEFAPGAKNLAEVSRLFQALQQTQTTAIAPVEP